jgi:hypothetical protein
LEGKRMRTLKFLAGSALAFSLMVFAPTAPTAQAAPAIKPSATAVDSGATKLAEPAHYKRKKHHHYRKHRKYRSYSYYPYSYRRSYRSYSPGLSLYIGPRYGYHRHGIKRHYRRW